MGTLIFIGGAESAPPPPVEVLQYPRLFRVKVHCVVIVLADILQLLLFLRMLLVTWALLLPQQNMQRNCSIQLPRRKLFCVRWRNQIQYRLNLKHTLHKNIFFEVTFCLSLVKPPKKHYEAKDKPA